MISTWRVEAKPVKPEDIPEDFDPAKHFWIISCDEGHEAINKTAAQIDMTRYVGWAFTAQKIGQM